MVDLCKMEAVYFMKMDEVIRWVKKVNPLGIVLDEDALNELMLNSDLLDITDEEKKVNKNKIL